MRIKIADAPLMSGDSYKKTKCADTKSLRSFRLLTCAAPMITRAQIVLYKEVGRREGIKGSPLSSGL